MDIREQVYMPPTRKNKAKLHNHLDFLLRMLQEEKIEMEHLRNAHKFVRMVAKSDERNKGLFHGDNKWYDYAKLAGLISQVDKELMEQFQEEYPELWI